LTGKRDAEDEDLRRVREYLLGAPVTRSSGPAATGGTAHPRTPLDEGLRRLSFNRPEREEIRRGPRSPKRNCDDVNLKRFRHHIAEGVRDGTPELEIASLALEWAELTSYDVGLAKRFWDAGFDLTDPGQFAAFVNAGFGLRELEEAEVQGKSVAQHLRERQTVKWCINALLWNRRSS
jgi:hypothetical protein